MKTFAFSLAVIVTCFAMSLHADNVPLLLSIAIPESETGERILDPVHNPHFHVVLSNVCDKAQRIRVPWSDLGQQALSFEFTDKEGKKWKAAVKERSTVSRRLSEFCVLQPRESLVFDVFYTDADAWDGFPRPKGPQQVSMRAIFEIPPDPGTEHNKLWTGKAVSDILRVKINPK